MKQRIVETYKGFLIHLLDGRYYASLGGRLFVTPEGKPAEDPAPYDTLDAAREAVDRVEITVAGEP